MTAIIREEREISREANLNSKRILPYSKIGKISNKVVLRMGIYIQSWSLFPAEGPQAVTIALCNRISVFLKADVTSGWATHWISTHKYFLTSKKLNTYSPSLRLQLFPLVTIQYHRIGPLAAEM